jgi:hypothetical protein
MDEAKLLQAVQHLAAGLSMIADMVPSGAPAVKNLANMAHTILNEISVVAGTLEASVGPGNPAEPPPAA